MKKLLLFVTFLTFVFPIFAAAETPASVECASRASPACDSATYDGEDNDGNSARITIERYEFDLTTKEVLSDESILSLIANDAFTPQLDTTDNIRKYTNHFQTVDGFRAIIGTSDTLYDDQPTMLLIVVNEGITYVFFCFGELHAFVGYAEDVVENDDLTIIPENFEVGEEDKGKEQTL